MAETNLLVTLKTTLFNPARAVLYNFFPAQLRSLIPGFLRGTVVRAADLAGSGLLVLAKSPVQPRLHPVLVAPLNPAVVFYKLANQKELSSPLDRVLTERQIDWEQLEDIQFQALENDPKALNAIKIGLQDKRLPPTEENSKWLDRNPSVFGGSPVSSPPITEALRWTVLLNRKRFYKIWSTIPGIRLRVNERV